MRSNSVVVTDSDASRARDVVRWLRASGIPAYAPFMDFPASTVVDAIGDLQPGVVMCHYDAAGVELLRSLHGMNEPPIVILLHENPTAGDEVKQMDGLVVAVIRAPIPMASLCAFVRTALSSATGLGKGRTGPRVSLDAGTIDASLRSGLSLSALNASFAPDTRAT